MIADRDPFAASRIDSSATMQINQLPQSTHSLYRRTAAERVNTFVPMFGGVISQRINERVDCLLKFEFDFFRAGFFVRRQFSVQRFKSHQLLLRQGKEGGSRVASS